MAKKTFCGEKLCCVKVMRDGTHSMPQNREYRENNRENSENNKKLER